MKKIIRRNTTFMHVLIIIAVALLEVLLITKGKNVFGYGGDWLMQSTSFYEYFRNLFYDTGDLFPDLALHIGGGQNIYYFVYYGLFSPYVLLFYLLPFIKAGDYLMISGVLNMIVSSILLYVFFQKNGHSKSISLLASLLLLVSTPVMFFNWTFIMFVQYMPFLILGFIATKRYLDTGKSLLLVISVILIIVTSYYFSICSIICLCVYALYYYIKIHKDLKISEFLKTGINYVLKIMLAILICSFLLFPVMYTIMAGRGDGAASINLSDFIFKIDLNSLMYNANGVGLSAIVWFAIMYSVLFMKKENRMLGIILLFIFGIPFFNLMFNGFLYLSNKVFVVFLPLLIILVIEMLENINVEKSNKILVTFIISLLVSLIMFKFPNFLKFVVFLFDLFMSYVILFLCRRKKVCIYVLVCFIFVISMFYIESQDFNFSLEKYNDFYEIINIDNSMFLNENEGMYRSQYDKNNYFVNYSDASHLLNATLYSSLYNKNYKDIYYDVFNNSHMAANNLILAYQPNAFFNKFMGIRYLMTDNQVPYGYEKIKEYNNITLYENDKVNSLGFVMSNLLSYEDYNKLSFVEKLLAYQNNIIIDGESSNSNVSLPYEVLELDYVVLEQENVSIDVIENNYIVDSMSNGKLTLLLSKPIKNKTLIIRFNIDNDPLQHVSISINGIKDTLSSLGYTYYNDNKTFDYVINSNYGIEKLNIEFEQGYYDISNIEIYAVDNTFFDKNNSISLNVDFDKTKGDNIFGNIDVKEDGYFIFTIPYDDGYTAYVDNKKVEFEKVNHGFIGFKISKGSHDIKLSFEAPFSKVGRFMSLVGILILVIIGIFQKYRERRI